MQVATILYADDQQVLVLCPYCDTFHKHTSTPAKNEPKTAHCQKGEYIFGSVVNPRDIKFALKRRAYELERKRKPKSISLSDTADAP